MSTVPPIQSFDPLKEVGHSGLRVFSGMISDSTLKNLRGPRRNEKLRVMAETDDIVGGILLAFETLGKSASWRVEAGGESPQDEEAADFVQSCFDDMSADWMDVLSGVFTFLPYGFAPHEIVYKRRFGDSPGTGDDGEPLPSSNIDDGRIGWHKWGLRAQTSIERWFFDKHGGIGGLWQRVERTGSYGVGQSALRNQSDVFIPAQKMLMFRTTAAKNNPEGRSFLESAFKSWFIKNHLIEMEAIGAEKDLVGYPTLKAPKEADIWGEDAKSVAAFMKAMEMVVGVRKDELMGFVYPDGWEFALVRSPGRPIVDIDKLIKRQNQGIAISILADFILIGHEGTGSLALRRSANDFFLMGLNGILDIITSTVNRQEIPRLLKLNKIRVEKPPKLVHGDPSAPDLEEMTSTFRELRDAGVDVVFSDVIISALLERAGLPIPEELGLPMQASENYDDVRGVLRSKERKRFIAGAGDGRVISRRQFFGGAQ